MSLSSADELLVNVGLILGLPDAKFDEDGDCSLEIDGKLALTIRKAEDGRLLLFAPVNTYAPHNEDVVAREIARANFFWAGTGGGTLGLNDVDRFVVLAEMVSLADLDHGRFAEILSDFVRMGLFWTDRLGAIETGGVESDSPLAEEVAVPMGSFV